MGHKIDIYSPKFVGKRFEDHTLPLELLEDLAYLEDVTIDLAKWVYLEENEDRQRVPRGFTKGMSIRLESIEPGSTQVKIALFILSATLFPPEHTEYFKKASGKFVEAIAAASKGENPLNYVPQTSLKYFNRIGKRLQDEEGIEFTSEDESKTTLTKEVRKNLILAGTSGREYTDEIDIRGKIAELDKSKKTFIFQLLDGRKIHGQFSDDNIKDLQEGLISYEEDQILNLTGIGKFNRSDKLEYIESIDTTELLEERDVPSRLEILSQLSDGWMDGEGNSLSKEGIEWLKVTFESHFDPLNPLPFLYPTLEGNILAEWSIEEYEISLEIDLERKVGDYHLLNTDSLNDNEDSMDLSTEEGWHKLNQHIKSIF